MEIPQLPENIARIEPGEPFSFLCHRNVGCFTHCCHQLELALTPYDVLRLRQATSLDSAQLLDRYIIVEQDEADTFPRFYLTMVDDGHASCVFVRTDGCSIYKHRPGACRTYPMGRGVTREHGQTSECFVLIHEPHCLGFQGRTVQTIDSYSSSQELKPYNRFNDLLAEIQQHPEIRKGMRLTSAQCSDYQLALYDIDTFRKQLAKNPVDDDAEFTAATFNDEELLLFSFQWLKKKLFGNA